MLVYVAIVDQINRQITKSSSHLLFEIYIYRETPYLSKYTYGRHIRRSPAIVMSFGKENSTLEVKVVSKIHGKFHSDKALRIRKHLDCENRMRTTYT